MTVPPAAVSSGAVPAAFELKSAQLTLVALVVKTHDLAIVAAELARSFGPKGESPDFFDTDGVVIDFTQTDIVLPHPQWELLMKAFAACKLVPMAVRGLDPASLAVAQRLGLTEAPPEPRRVVAPGAKAVPASAPLVPVSVPVPATVVVPAPAARTAPAVAPVAAQPVASAPPAAREAAPVPTMVITKPLRSGQKIYARGGDLVVLAMVNRGAEVIADGNIHVYAPLRGKAMAGARGNTAARIFSLCLEPELVSIAGIYRTTEKELAGDVLGKPAQVRLSDDGSEKLIIESLKS
jgi:septum site-determining protein MinC